MTGDLKYSLQLERLVIQSPMCAVNHGVPIQLLNTKPQVNLPVWQCSSHCHTLISGNNFSLSSVSNSRELSNLSLVGNYQGMRLVFNMRDISCLCCLKLHRLLFLLLYIVMLQLLVPISFSLAITFP